MVNISWATFSTALIWYSTKIWLTSLQDTFSIALFQMKFELHRRASVSAHWTWWRHQMETFSVLLAMCAVNSPITAEFPAQRPVTRSFDVLFDLHLNKRLSKQSWGWWLETLSRPLWRHSNEPRQNCSHFTYGGIFTFIFLYDHEWIVTSHTNSCPKSNLSLLVWEPQLNITNNTPNTIPLIVMFGIWSEFFSQKCYCGDFWS